MKTYDFIKKNKGIIDRLYKCGTIGSTTLRLFNIYESYKSTKPVMGGKMQRYEEVAMNEGVSTRTVIRAVKVMEGEYK